MQFSAKLISVAVFCLLSGCASLNPFASKPDPKKLPAPLVEIKQALSVKQVWSAPVGASAKYVFAPAADGNDLYAAAADGTVIKVDAQTGRIQWRINAGVGLTGGVGAGSGSVVVAGEKGNLLAFDADGKVLWKIQQSSEVLSAPAIARGLVIVRSNDNKITAYDQQNGGKKWSVERPLPSLICEQCQDWLLMAIRYWLLCQAAAWRVCPLKMADCAGRLLLVNQKVTLNSSV